VQPLLTQLLLNDKPLGQPQHLPVKWHKNRVNETSGRVSYKHQLQLTDAMRLRLPAGAWVDTVKWTGRDSIYLSCRTTLPGSRPKPQQQLHTGSSIEQQALIASQHAVPPPSPSKRRSLQAALKVTSAAAKRQRTHHSQPGLAGQHSGSSGGAHGISSSSPLAGERPHATLAPPAAATAAGLAVAASGAQPAAPAAGSELQPCRLPPSSGHVAASRRLPMVGGGSLLCLVLLEWQH
jgi:hypothetical protein